MRRPHKSLYVILGFLAFYGTLMGSFLGCTRTIYVDSNQATEVKDTTEQRLVSVDKIKGQLALELGQSISVPDMSMKITRVSDSLMLVETPVRHEVRTETRTRFVQTKSIARRTVVKDKSRHGGDRTYTDSNNEIKVKDKSQSRGEPSGVSGNKINLGGWWLLLLAGLVFLVYRFRKILLPILRL